MGGEGRARRSLSSAVAAGETRGGFERLCAGLAAMCGLGRSTLQSSLAREKDPMEELGSSPHLSTPSRDRRR